MEQQDEFGSPPLFPEAPGGGEGLATKQTYVGASCINIPTLKTNSGVCISRITHITPKADELVKEPTQVKEADNKDSGKTT